MSKRQIIIILGVFVMIFLFLGFPSSWDKFLALLDGILVVIFAYSLKPEPASPRAARSAAEAQAPYVEHKAEDTSDIINPIPPAAR